MRSGLQCVDNYSARGNKKIEEKWPQLETDIKDLVEPYSQVDPDFKRPFAYARITARAVRQALINEKGYRDEDLPTERTILNVLNRLGYSLKRVEKTRPLKKIEQVDEIFENVHEANRVADEDPESLRISIDTKAKVKIGPFSRNGQSRGQESGKAADHDPEAQEKLVPLGILEVLSGLLTIFFCQSIETTDFIVDSLELWWENNQPLYSSIKTLVINLDNGPHLESHRTQFIKRIVEFSQATGLRIHLVYYPPYHSKYNPIERCWGALEKYWNGTILDSVDKALNWAQAMTWKGLSPVIHWVDKIYQEGVSLTKKELMKFEENFKRSNHLPKWDVVIEAS
jgi:transposase